MDLGECMKVHDLALRADYEIASKEQEYFFELDVSNEQPLSQNQLLPSGKFTHSVVMMYCFDFQECQRSSLLDLVCS